MNSIKCIAKNTLFLSLSEIINLFSGFIFFMYLARYLGVENFGIINFALAFTSMFSIIIDLGLSQLMVREVTRNKKLVGKYIKNAMYVKILLAIIYFIIIYVYVELLSYPHKKQTVLVLIGLSVILSSFSQINYSIFTAYEKMEYKAIGIILNSFLMVVGLCYIIHQDYDVIAISLLYFISSLVVLLYSMLIVNWKFVETSKEFDWIFLKSMIKQALPFGFSIIFVSIYYQIDSVMLSMFEGDVSVGIYNAAYRLVFTVLAIRSVIHSSTFPLLARSYMEKSKDYFESICEKLFISLFMIIFPIAVGTTILADKFIFLIYGADYNGSIIALQILIWSNVIIFINSYPRLFETSNNQIVFAKIAAIGAVLNIILNYFMIPIWSYIGASIATVLTELIVLVICYKSATSIYNIRNSKFPKSLPPIILSGTIMGLFTGYISNENLAIVIITSAIIYTYCLYFTKVINTSSLYALKNLLISSEFGNEGK